MWDDAWLYDVQHRGTDFDLPFWLGLIDEYRPRRVLELASGTGRLAFPLAARATSQTPGCQLVGLDFSAPFVARARERLRQQEPALVDAVTFVEGDMRAFDLDGPFDLIILGLNGFAYLHSVEDQLACLGAVRRHLAGGGRFAIDLVVPHLRFLDEAHMPVPPIRAESDHPAPEEGVARFIRNYADRYDAETQTLTSTYFYEIFHLDGRQDRFVKDLAWHMYFPNELQLLFRVAGLRVVERWGSYDRAPFSSRSRQYLWVMEAA